MAIIWKLTPAPDIDCPLCSAHESAQLFLQITVGYFPDRHFELYRCLNCRSCFFPNVSVPDYSLTLTTDLIKHYSEVGAGLPFILEPIIAVRNQNSRKTVLDVGCSFGYSIDFASKVLNWQAIGVEPSSIGAVGMQALGVKIYNDYLEDVVDLSGRSFGVVYSSEVIEHASEPQKFVRLLTQYLAPEGILVLTTPNAEYVEPGRTEAELIQTLSPGYHLNLFSAFSLTELLKSNGLPFVTVLQKDGSNLVVCAARHELTAFSNQVGEPYREYLELRTEGSRDNFVYDGFAYRLFFELIAASEYDRAFSFWDRWAPDLCCAYPKSMNPWDLIWLESARSFQVFGESAPYFIVGLFYCLAVLHINHLRRYELAARYASAGFIIAKQFISDHPHMAGQTTQLLWKLKFTEGLAQLLFGRPDLAISAFTEVTDHEQDGFSGVRPQADVIVDTSYQLAMAWCQTSEEGNAAAALRRVAADCNVVLAGDAVMKLAQLRARQRENDLAVLAGSLRESYLAASIDFGPSLRRGIDESGQRDKRAAPDDKWANRLPWDGVSAILKGLYRRLTSRAG